LNTTDASGNPTNRPLGTTFVIGIITPDHEARFIGDVVQYDGDITVNAGPTSFSADINKYTWIEALTGYDSTGTLLDFWGYVWTRALILGTYSDPGEDEDIRHTYTLYYNTTFTVLPNVEHLGGEWRIQNAIVDGNTASITITPDVGNTTGGNITGSDNLANTFTGRVTILYDLYNVYRVEMSINGGETLTGLATYIEEVHTIGIDIPRSMAIGVNNASGNTSFSGIADQQ